MSTLYVTEQYAVVKKDGDCLTVHIPEDKQRGTEKRTVRVPLVKVDQVVLYGDATLTTPALAALLAQRADVCYCSRYGRFIGRLTPEFSKNGLLRIAQHRVSADREQAVELARQFVRGKLSNLRTLLLRANRKRDDQAVARAVASLKAAIDRVNQLGQANEDDGLLDDEKWPELDYALDPKPVAEPSAQGSEAGVELQIEDSGHQAGRLGSRMESLRGLEGAGTAAYFGVFGRLLQQDLGFRGRTRRPPTDPVNALLSFGYTLLMNQVMTAIGIVGMDPYVGFLHVPHYGRPALALDLMEEFRPVVVDSVVLTLINTNALQAKDFESQLGAYRLTDPGRRTFLEKFEERLSTEIQHPVFGYKATYRRCLELQARLLGKALTGEIGKYEPFVVR